MSAFKKGIAIVLAGAFAAGIAGTIAYPQGAVTLVQLVLGGTLVSSSNPLPVTMSGDGGGLSVVDGTVFTAGTSPFTPTGCEYNSSPTTLTTGTQGTLACNQYRSAFVDVMTTNNNLYAAITAPVPCLTAATSTTNSYTPPAAAPANCDPNGNLFVNAKLASGSALTANQGTANTTGNAWPIKNTDGTNTAAVKAASTAPAATDPALVVAISPNGINANGSATSANSAPVVIASDQASVSIKGTGPAAISAAVPTTQSSQYPTNATTTTPTAVTATATGTTAATAASLGATASVTNFVCGFDITADAAALATGTATLSGTISGSLNYLQTITAITNGTSQLTRVFNPCIPASAANTAITITSAAAGTSGNTIVNIWGYRL